MTGKQSSYTSRLLKAVARPFVFVAKTLYTGLDNLVYNAPRVRPVLRDGYYINTLLALAIAGFSIAVLVGALGSYPGVFVGTCIAALAISLGCLLPTRMNTQTHEDADMLLVNLFRMRPVRSTKSTSSTSRRSSSTKSRSAQPSVTKNTSKKATASKPASKKTVKKATTQSKRSTTAKKTATAAKTVSKKTTPKSSTKKTTTSKKK